MEDRCRLYVSLGSGRRHRGEVRPNTFLRFIRTGLLVGLPDEPSGQLVGDGSLKQFPMRRVDAEGLGLIADDFAEGVAICREDPATAGLGWQCERVQLLIGAEERIAALAMRAQPAFVDAAAAPPAAPAAPHLRPRRILVAVDADAPDGATIDEAAMLAREHGATVLLVATGELPETRRHADEERTALMQRLDEVAANFAGLSVRCIVEMGGDPVRDILAVADSEGVDLIMAPAARSRFADAIEPRIAAALERRAAVPVRTAVAPAAAAPEAAPARTRADAVRIVIPGLPHGRTADLWTANVDRHVRGALEHIAFERGGLAVEARWYAAPGTRVDHFDLAPVLAAIAAQPAWPEGVTPRTGRLASEVIAVADAADERLELDIHAA